MQKIPLYLIMAGTTLLFFCAACVPLRPIDDSSYLIRAEEQQVVQANAQKIRSAKLVYNVSTPAEPAGQVLIRYKAPNKYRFDYLSTHTAGVVCLIGNNGWGYQPKSGVYNLTGQEVAMLRYDVESLPFHSRLHKLFPDIRMVGEETVNGERCRILRGRKGPDELKFWVGRDTQLLHRTRGTIDGAPCGAEYFNYSRHQNVLMARTILATGPRGFSRRTLQSVEWNVPIDNSVFQPLRPLPQGNRHPMPPPPARKPQKPVKPMKPAIHAAPQQVGHSHPKKTGGASATAARPALPARKIAPATPPGTVPHAAVKAPHAAERVNR
ncbi:MAG: hypothetical protein PHS41_04785 [Victivallaceae bacterium]|nr:hypothetical protein [Victivallaceae bacterium]